LQQRERVFEPIDLDVNLRQQQTRLDAVRIGGAETDQLLLQVRQPRARGARDDVAGIEVQRRDQLELIVSDGQRVLKRAFQVDGRSIVQVDQRPGRIALDVADVR